MKRVFILGVLCLLATFGASAQTIDGRINITNIDVSQRGDQVNVAFTATVDTKAVSRNHTLVFAPVLTDGTYSQSLPAVVVHGPGSRASQQRREWVAGTTADYPDAVITTNGQTVRYSADVPLQLWMNGAGLAIESVEGGCCTYNALSGPLLAENLKLWEVVKVEEPIVAVQEPEVTVGDSLAVEYPFVVPLSEFDAAEPFKIYDDERKNSLIVYYRVAKHDIDRNYMGNEATLKSLITAINMILDSKDSNVKHIIVAGFASPEGSLQFNDRLAFERAVSVKQYIMQNTDMRDEQIMLYNGSVDYRGLRALVEESNMPSKVQVIDIIDNVPLWDSQRQVGRLGELMKLDGGRPYRYMLENFFPYLRNGAFIKVFYENK